MYHVKLKAYMSKYNHERDNQVHLLMITDDDEYWFYLAVKGFSRLLRGITPKNNEGFYLFKLFSFI